MQDVTEIIFLTIFFNGGALFMEITFMIIQFIFSLTSSSSFWKPTKIHVVKQMMYPTFLSYNYNVSYHNKQIFRCHP